MLEKTYVLILIVIITVVIWCVHLRRSPCPEWLSWLVELDNPFFKINRSATIIKHLDLVQGMSVVDVGCGPGRLTIPLARAIGPTGHVLAMDIQAGMLDKVQKKVNAADLKNVKFLHAGIGEKKLKHEKFDRALLVTVLGEVSDCEGALKEIFDALKPGGILSVTEIILDPHFLRQSTVLRLARSVGFQEIKIFGNWFAFTILLEKPF